MLILFGILVIIASIVLGLIVLVQNPKGGGLSSSFGGFGNQIMGVKQTTDVLEKGTWIFALVIAVLCLTSTIFISGRSTGEDKTQKVGTSIPQQQQSAPPPALALPTDTGKK